ncbi:enoyl-[acyl-carrier- ] reductase, mitochondrial isoform X1 [Paramuricea clavata]|uniref:Enoyl-[acyl-carrier-protein] reductase, mitochondrial n=1 Tax=Paramuricea clavata TaxID=317549 RepID=A0A6S7IHQ8_PARCT|nr:enoyl-[acyl-carrier- ] reductase, mitochondrial isoform X1 [Paramuricea clavata]
MAVSSRFIKYGMQHIKTYIWRTYCSAVANVPRSCRGLVYTEYGDPAKVISLQDFELPEFDEQSVFLEMLATPINPADLNMVQGTYPIKPCLPAVGGNEGVGEVLAVGSGVKNINIGDWVLMASAGLGCWTEKKVLNEKDVLKIPVKEGLPVEVAAMLSVNPCTAYRMLKDFEYLHPGDVILQNGANSGVGQAVIQLSANWGITSLNVVRDRDNFEELKENLTSLGATYVVTEDEFQNANKIKEILKDHKPPRLAFNCVGGKSSTQLIRYLSEKGTMVTYGGMSRKPITVPTSAFIFKDIQLRGFWMTKWNEYNLNSPERTMMLEDLCEMAKCGDFTTPDCETFQLNDYENALLNSVSSFTKKSLFLMNSGRS